MQILLFKVKIIENNNYPSNQQNDYPSNPKVKIIENNKKFFLINLQSLIFIK